jgi:hypothetical protein
VVERSTPSDERYDPPEWTRESLELFRCPVEDGARRTECDAGASPAERGNERLEEVANRPLNVPSRAERISGERVLSLPLDGTISPC